VTASPQPQPAATAPAAAAPFTNRELADELRRQGVGAAAAGKTSPGEEVPEIKETARGVVITLPHTLFAFDSFDLDAPARRVVERIAYVLNHPRAVSRAVVLEGHADAIGTEAYNLALSRRRAETVARELIGQGVRRERVKVEAFGETRPIAPNKKPDGTDDPAGRAKNRRVEAVIPN
jgi:outer membrane protein OmpA-like peptidoglycan-associated protein